MASPPPTPRPPGSRRRREVVYQANIDATQSDMTPDMLRARNAGAEAIIVWSVSTGMIGRLLNTRGTMGWDVPFIGHPSLASGDIAQLLDKPENWKKVYAVGYRSCSYDANGKLPPHSQELVTKLAGKVDLQDTLLWWVVARRRRGEPGRRCGERDRQQQQRRDHQILERPEELARLFRQLFLLRDGP